MRLMLRLPGYHPKKTARVVWGHMFSEGAHVWGRGASGVVVGVAQNGTVECEKVHSRRVSIGAAESTPGYQPSA